MKKVIFIKYIDSLYYTEKKLKYNGFKPHVAIGQLILKSNEHITISFTEKNGIAETGLLIPKKALIFQKRKESIINNLDHSKKINSEVGVFWKDIVYFSDSKIPKECTSMYSEGKLFFENHEVIIVKNPETIKIKKKIENHPRIKVYFIAIPKPLITNIEIYDKKI